MRNERELDGALRQSEALRQAILHQAFTGRLVPQDPADEPASALLARLRDMTANYPESEPLALAAAEPPVDRPKPATRANQRLASGTKI